MQDEIKSWVCPHCQFAQIVDKQKLSNSTSHVNVSDHARGNVVVKHLAIGCANPSCKQLTLDVIVGEGSHFGSHNKALANWYMSKPIASYRFFPRGASKPQPRYIPAALRADYEEACSIRDLSPKASATLVRRCIQGAIRDFCGITKGSLDAEIKALRKAVEGSEPPRGVAIETVDAIDHVRGIGNIGAHMEKDISVIVDVDPNEAQMLIELVEMLFEEWYVARYKREQSLAAISALGQQKQEARKRTSGRDLEAPEERADTD